MVVSGVYTPIREIGRGSFGIVFEVATADGRRFARKEFHIAGHAGVDPTELRSRFRREVTFQSKINHENVVRILDSDVHADIPWFLMELAQCSMADELILDRTLGGQPEKALFDILAGLEEVHTKGFVHRDLKPQNVLKFLGPIYVSDPKSRNFPEFVIA